MSWMCCIFGCVGYNRVRDKRQGFVGGEGLRVGYKPADRSHPKIKQKREPRRFLFKALSIKEGGYLLSRIALQYHRRKRA